MIVLIVNPASKSGWPGDNQTVIESFLETREETVEVCYTRYPGHAKELADEACSRIATSEETGFLLVLGGDGTFNEVINGMHGFDRVCLGLIPSGSGNDLARGLSIAVGDPVERLSALLDAAARVRAQGTEPLPKMDLGLLRLPTGEERRFAISAGIGVDAEVCREVNTSGLKKALNRIGLGSAAYGILTVKNLFHMPLYDGVLTTEDGGEKKLEKVIFCAAMNQPSEGGGVPMSPDATAFDGLLSVCAVHAIPRLACFAAFPLLLAAKHRGLKGFDLFACKSLRVELDHAMTVHADGEYCGSASSLEFVCEPGRVLLLG